MRVWTAVLVVIACGAAAAVAAPPPRVVSLDYCADQYVLALADRAQILAVSPAAGAEYSYMAARAQGVPTARPTAEAALMLSPDLVVRQWGGGFGAPEVLARFGIPVAQIGDDASLEQARASLIAIGAALGQSARAQALAAEMDRRLAAVAAPAAEKRPRALYVTAGGMSSGAGTFIDAILKAAGVGNLTAEKGRRGWAWVDMEGLALDPPDLFVTGFFDKRERAVDNWSPSRHAFLQDELAARPAVHLASRQVACPGWFVTDAIEAIAATRSALK